MRVQPTLREEDAERWEEIRDELERRMGYRPGHAETARLVMSAFKPENVMEPDQPAGLVDDL